MKRHHLNTVFCVLNAKVFRLNMFMTLFFKLLVCQAQMI